ncbi:MAG: hypothetical protein JKY89_03435 [Immundisolibacteraceae bacterium]|nr:hypothetical protein [Immundisolibacteraceae bacterium]
MSENIEDLTVEWEEGGLVTVKELDKKVLSKGAWSTIIYKYQDFNNSKQEYGPAKFTIRRYQKRNGVYSQKSKFNISSFDQAQQVIDALDGWLKEDA